MKIKTLVKVTTLSIITSSALYSQELESTNKLDKVTVTANKMEEDIQDVPQSITVLSGDVLQEKGAKTALDIIKEIPNMNAYERTGTMVNFRGLNTSTFTNNNPVVLYVNGVPVADRSSFKMSMANIERVEVLRGPQGTLYGKDAIGAVINVITKGPQNLTGGEIEVEYGSDNTKIGKVNVSGPIKNDTLYFNLNGEMKQTDGWVTNTFTNDDKASAKDNKKFGTSFTYKVSDKLSAELNIRTIDKEDKNVYATGTRETDLSKVKRELREKISVDVPGYEKYDIDTQSLNINYNTDEYNLSSVTTRKTTHLDGEYDGDFVSNSSHPDGNGLKQWMDQEIEEYTQEFRISNNTTEGLKWISGLYLDKGEVDNKRYGWEFGNRNNLGAILPGASYQDAPSTTDTETQALFGQTMIPVTDNLEVTLGGRYQKITKDMDYKMYYLAVGTPTTGQTPAHTLNGGKSWDTFLPKIAASYKLDENTTTFASISKGYMPGGFNFFSNSGTLEDVTFKPQTSITYEVGIKGVLENASYSASIFRMDIKDIHVYRIEGGGQQYLTDNANKAHSQGIEFDFTYFPTDTIEISGAAGFIDAKYDDFDAGEGKNYNGERIEQTPSHTANLSLAYYDPSGFYARTDLRHAGSMYFLDNTNKEFLKADGYTTADIKIGYRVSDWDTYGYVKNITDEEYITNYMSNPSVGGLATFNDPRTIGIALKYKF